MLMTSKTLYAALSDFEIMTGFHQFESILRMDDTSHEAMFGLGKINFMIKRYEIAVHWFN